MHDTGGLCANLGVCALWARSRSMPMDGENNTPGNIRGAEKNERKFDVANGEAERLWHERHNVDQICRCQVDPRPSRVAFLATDLSPGIPSTRIIFQISSQSSLYNPSRHEVASKLSIPTGSFELRLGKQDCHHGSHASSPGSKLKKSSAASPDYHHLRSTIAKAWVADLSIRVHDPHAT